MSQNAKMFEQLNAWRNDKLQAGAGNPRKTNRTVSVNGQEVLVTYKRRRVGRAAYGR
jgi:hypothetical protein